MPVEQEEFRPFAHGRFVPKRILGRGGAGIVYLADDIHTCQQVALKVPYKHLARHRSVRTRMRNEARMLAMIRHPGVPIVFDCEGGDDYPYCAIELIEGVNLAEALDNGAIPPRAATKIMRDLAMVLGQVVHGHARRIIHRDIKPDNIRLRHNGSLVLTDFGIAKILNIGLGNGNTIVHNLTRNAGGIGTPGYASDKQWGGEDIDEQDDLFSLGVTYWTILTNPLADEKDPAVADRTRKRWKKWEVKSVEDPSFAGVPECLRPVIVGCFQGDFHDASEFLEALAIAEKSLPEDGSERFWEDLRISGVQTGTIVPMIDALEDIDAGLVSQDVLPPDDLQVGADDHDLNDDEEDDEIVDEGVPEITRTDPVIRLQRRNKRYLRNTLTGLAAAIALIAVTWAVTVKNGLSSPTVVPSSGTILSDSVVSATQSPTNAGFVQTVAGFEEHLDVPAPTVVEVTLPKTEFRSTPSVPVNKKAALVVKDDRPVPVTPPAAKVVDAPVAPPSGEGQVRLLGKPAAAHLTSESGGGTFSIPGKVPPGLYRIGAKFQGDDTFKDFGTVKIEPGAAVTIRCDTAFGTCQ